LREKDIEKSRASMEISKFAEIAIGMSNPLDSATLLSLRLGKETSKGGKGLVVTVLMRT